MICFDYGTSSQDDIISKSMNYVRNGNNKLEHSDTLIRAIVADQVKTLCAAEVQKKVLSQNKEVTRYRNNPT
ncbi:8539_t:CDS:1, partial [Cetraspora pellucida]